MLPPLCRQTLNGDWPTFNSLQQTVVSTTSQHNQESKITTAHFYLLPASPLFFTFLSSIAILVSHRSLPPFLLPFLGFVFLYSSSSSETDTFFRRSGGNRGERIVFNLSCSWIVLSGYTWFLWKLTFLPSRFPKKITHLEKKKEDINFTDDDLREFLPIWLLFLPNERIHKQERKQILLSLFYLAMESPFIPFLLA